MCGIVGMFCFDGGVGAWNGTIVKSIGLMARRGPDDEGMWSDGHTCSFGFRRLAVLDLSPAGRQPMQSQDGRHVLVFNGELYNFRQLRRDLQREGVAFHSTGDAEVVLYALARWGTEALASFNGMFALGFYDAVERRLLLARDHAGIKPLYYLQSASGIFFASQYDQILAHPWTGDRDVLPDSLALYLQLGYLPPPFAMLRGSSALEPGAWLTVDADGQLRRGRHFSFPVLREPDLYGALANEAVDAAVTAAVERQMVSDVPVGVFLSGGIDSPLVAAKMRQAARVALPAFTLGTNGGELDESDAAAAYAAALHLDHEVRHITPAAAVSMLDEVVAACSEPLDDYSMFPTMLISQHARQRVKVILSGDGGDDIFFGYTARSLPLLRWAESDKGAQLTSTSEHRGARLTPGDDYLARQRFVPQGWMESLFTTFPAWPAECDLFRRDDAPVDHVAQWIRWNEFTGHLTRVLLKVDRASMYHSLEVRVPLLDREVIDVACRVDWRSCVDLATGIGKRPLREALARHVRFQTNTKRGFTVPMAEWLRGALRPIFEDVIASRTDILGLPLQRVRLREQFEHHLAQRADFGWGLWRLLSLRLWEDRHYRRGARAT